jgi:hypothetical protein
MFGSTLHQRYVSGERVPVWDEMIRSGASIREEPVLSDALAVVREVVERSHRNLVAIHDRLVGLGYKFAKSGCALVEAGPGAEGRIEEIEAALGTMPLLLREWYLRFDAVDFSQSASQEVGSTESRVAGLGYNCTLIMRRLDACREHWECLRRQHDEDVLTAREPERGTLGTDHLLAFLPIGPSATNCELMGFDLPNPGVDGVYYNEGAGDIFFIDHLRKIFEWGGFPICQFYIKKRKRHLGPRPDLETILPMLRDGLEPV